MATVQDEGDDQVLVFEAKIRGQLAESLILQEAEASEAEAPDGHLGAYKPPRIAQAMCFSLRGFEIPGFPDSFLGLCRSVSVCRSSTPETTYPCRQACQSLCTFMYFFVSVFAG